jgi:predicted transcriptional regulator
MTARLRGHHGLRVRRLPAHVLGGSLRRYDRHRSEVLFADRMDGASLTFQTALQIVYLEMADDLDRLTADIFTQPAAEELARRALANYAAAALIMPYERFRKEAEARRYDVEALARHFAVSFEQAAHRLTTLQRPGEEGVSFFFIRVDPAGNVSKRLDGAGFPFARYGGACPLWSVHSVFRQPRRIVTQWLELPDGARFFSIARTVTAGGGSWDTPIVERAVALACAASEAGRLVYADGVDPKRVAATPVGTTCRVCQRTRCAARAVPPLGRDILPDDYHRPGPALNLAEG